MGSAGEINGGGVKNRHPCKPVFFKYFVPKIRDNKADYFNEQLPPDQSEASCNSTNRKFVFLLSFIIIIFSNYSEQRELFKKEYIPLTPTQVGKLSRQLEAYVRVYILQSIPFLSPSSSTNYHDLEF